MEFFKKRSKTGGPDFKAKAQSKNGIISCIIALFAVVILWAAIIRAADVQETGAGLSGIFGILDFLLSISGLVMAGEGMKEHDVNYFFPIAGVLLNGFLFVYLFGLYLYGLV